MRKSVQRNANHLALIRNCMFALPLETARVLYKCVLATFVTSAKKAQKAASNVNSDITTADRLTSEEYLQALGTLGDQWKRANKKSRKALHNLRCLDEATMLGKLRTSTPRYAAGGFDHAIHSIHSGYGHFGEKLPFEEAPKNAMKAVMAYQTIPDTEGVPIETRTPSTDPPSAPLVVQNYLVF